MLEALIPLAVIDLAVVPCIDPLSVGLSILEETEVRVGVRVSFEAAAVAHVLVPLTLILPSVLVPHHASALSLSSYHLPHV